MNQVDTQGRKQGPWELYFDDGKIRANGQYVGDKRQGPWQFFYESGKLRAMVTYHGGLMDSVAQHYHPNGKLAFKGEFKADRPWGLWSWYYEDGRLRRRKTYAGTAVPPLVKEGKLGPIQKLIRGEVDEILKEKVDKSTLSASTTKVEPDKPTAVAVEKPQSKPKRDSPAEQPKDNQQDTSAVLAGLTDGLIRKIRHGVGTPTSDDLTTMLISLIQAWGMTSDDKLAILKDIRNATIH